MILPRSAWMPQRRHSSGASVAFEILAGDLLGLGMRGPMAESTASVFLESNVAGCSGPNTQFRISNIVETRLVFGVAALL